ncbi:MAG TPA: hypothetical protein VF844_14895 [Ktedonobacteraceae bacterium]
MPNFGTGLTTRERALAGEITQVNIFQDFLTLEYEQEKLSRYGSRNGNWMSGTLREWAILASIAIPINLLNKSAGRQARSSGS